MHAFPLSALAIIPLFLSFSAKAGIQNTSYWESPNKEEVIITIPSQNLTHYFSNEKSNLCFSFKVQGIWSQSGIKGVIQSIDKQRIGVKMLSSKDLEPFSGNSLFEKAVERAQIIGTMIVMQDIPAKFTKYEAKREKSKTSKYQSFKYSLYRTFEHNNKEYTGEEHKYFVDIKPGWIAQITLLTLGGNMRANLAKFDVTAKYLINNLEYTNKKDCYWPIIRELKSQSLPKSKPKQSEPPSFIH